MSLNSVRLLYLESLHSSRLMVDRARIKYKPDGNFGWIAVLGSLIISILADGYTYTAGQFYEQFLTVYGKSETITSIYIAIMTSSIFSICKLNFFFLVFIYSICEISTALRYHHNLSLLFCFAIFPKKKKPTSKLHSQAD